MANYGAIKTMKASSIGTIMPWTGSLSEIPKGWIICDGSGVSSRDYPLLAQAIGETYGASPGFSVLDFPWNINNPTHQFFLPDISQKSLADIQTDYFGANAIESAIDTVEAAAVVGGFIGANTDNGAPNRISDANTDILFTYDPESDFSGRIEDQVFDPGVGVRTLYTGGRKLGRRHMPIHTHPTSVPTIAGINSSKPGSGVSCSREFEYDFFKAAFDDFLGIFQTQIQISGFQEPNGTALGNGSPGVVLGNVQSEVPPTNLKPKDVYSHGISNWIGRDDAPDVPDPLREPNFALANKKFEIAQQAPYGLGGDFVDTTHRNYDDGSFNHGDGSGSNDEHLPYEVFFNSSAIDFNVVNEPPVGQPTQKIEAHDHQTFQIEYSDNDSTLRVPSNLATNVTSNVVPNNLPGALNITTTIPTPKLVVLYIIRAY